MLRESRFFKVLKFENSFRKGRQGHFDHNAHHASGPNMLASGHVASGKSTVKKNSIDTTKTKLGSYELSIDKDDYPYYELVK